MTERFYLPTDLTAPTLQLAGSEARHAVKVLRLEPGRHVVLFDGNGAEVEATIESISGSLVSLRPGPVRYPARSVPLTIAVAPPKGDRFRWLVEKATELGVQRLIPLQTERTVVVPGSSKLEKLRKTIIAACKQSGRCDLMELTKPVAFAGSWNWLDQAASAQEGDNGPRILCHPGGPPLASVVSQFPPSFPLNLLIGPEGDFTPSEIDQAREAGAEIASLGNTILRTETAAIAAAAMATGLRGKE